MAQLAGPWEVQDLAQRKEMQLDFRKLQAGIGKRWHTAADCGWFLVVKGELAMAEGGGERQTMAASSHLACSPSG
jgi:hypothetical protein